MARRKITYEEAQQVHEAVVEQGGVRAAARALGMSYATVQKRNARWTTEYAKGTPEADKGGTAEHITVDLSSSKGQVSTAKSTRITSLEQALEAANVDLDVWEVERHIINKWEVGAKDEATGSIVVEPLFQVKVWLKRKVVNPAMAALENLVAQLIDAPIIPAPTYVPMFDPHMLEVSLYDHHFGKYAWEKETGHDYDLDLAEEIYVNAACDLLNKAKGFPIELITLVVGQDFLHINNVSGTTEKGTRQDVDTRLARVAEIGMRAVIRCIEKFREVAPVKVLWVPGNHDPLTSYFLCRELKAYYRNDDSVEVDVSPKYRKRIVYGCNLIAYTHGNEEKHVSLPAIMAGEWPEEWAATKYREWHTGHLHKKKQTQYSSADTYVGVTVRILSSLSATDAWHYKKGYINNARAAEAFVWSKTKGHAATFYSNLEE